MHITWPSRRTRTWLRPSSVSWIILATSVWMASLGNVALWREMYRLGLLHSAGDFAFAAALGSIVLAALLVLLRLVAWRGVLKPALTLLLLVAAAGAHFMLSYGIVIDSTMLVNVLQTDAREAVDLISWRMAGTLALLGGLPVLWLWCQPLAFAPWPRQLLRNTIGALAAFLLLTALVMASFQPLAADMRNHKQLRYLLNPLNTVYALGHMATTPLRRDTFGIEPIGLDAVLTLPKASLPSLSSPASVITRPPLLILVLGETGRSNHFELNGYARSTAPELVAIDKAEPGALVSFDNAWSCGTSTAASVPCMFSHLGQQGYADRERNYEGLLDVLQRAGLAVLWLDNQAGCKGVCNRLATAPGGSINTLNLPHPQLCPAGECFDAILLDQLDARMAALPAERRAKGVVLVLHQMGSHGPAYYERSPPAFKRFLPECTTVDLQKCSRAELVNAYDNSIAYTDHVLASGIRWLAQPQQQAAFDTALLYVSDHGESLGENNIYLHGLPYAIAPDVQKQVPWISWLSQRSRQRLGIDSACLQNRKSERLSHDHYFHSVLGLLGVQTALYNKALDAYAPCYGNADKTGTRGTTGTTRSS